jgi:hypothetical protein
MKSLKDNWAIVLIFIAISAGFFYWFGYRDSQIRTYCSFVTSDPGHYGFCLRNSGVRE